MYETNLSGLVQLRRDHAAKIELFTTSDPKSGNQSANWFSHRSPLSPLSPGLTMSRSCAFLTIPSLAGFFSDDHLLHGPLAAAGWRLESIPWRQGQVDWGRFDLVLIRSTWDYYLDPEAFLATLAEIDHSGTCLQNDLRLVQWTSASAVHGIPRRCWWTALRLSTLRCRVRQRARLC